MTSFSVWANAKSVAGMVQSASDGGLGVSLSLNAAGDGGVSALMR